MLPTDLETYAAVVAGLSAGRPRADLLVEHGLDEPQFDQLEQRVELEMSRAMDSAGDAVPPFLVAYEAALRKAQLAAQGPTSLTLEQFARAISALERSSDPRHALEKLGLKPEELSRALAHFGPRLAKDPELAKRFGALREGKREPEEK